jgi:hypothetical protein
MAHHHPFTHRSSIAGLPIGPREPDWSSILGSAVAVLSVLGTLEAGLVVRRKVNQLKQRLAAPLQEGKELVNEGEDLVHDLSEFTSAVSGVSHAASAVGGNKAS